jgi:hypothetical protein
MAHAKKMPAIAILCPRAAIPAKNKKTAAAAKAQNKKREIETIDAAAVPASIAAQLHKNIRG